MSHTPGPWTFDGRFIKTRDGRMVIDSARSKAEITATSHLIAAAPELLRELKRWRAFAKQNGWTDADYHDADGSGWISAMDAAIDKAEGRPE